MDDPRRGSIRFTVNGQRYELTSAVVEKRLADVMPEPIRKHAVQINSIWYPVIQAFETASGIPRSHFISHTARRHLSALGFTVGGEIESRTTPTPSTQPRPIVSAPRTSMNDGVEREWHTEANIQGMLVTELVITGWRILSVANTATKEHGIDVIAEYAGRTTGVEVKGFPSRDYAAPQRAGETKRTSPSTQAGHWFAQAILAAMRLRGKEPHWRSVIALPDFRRYRDLHVETATSLDAAEIEIWWVGRDGAVTRP